MDDKLFEERIKNFYQSVNNLDKECLKEELSKTKLNAQNYHQLYSFELEKAAVLYDLIKKIEGTYEENPQFVVEKCCFPYH